MKQRRLMDSAVFGLALQRLGQKAGTSGAGFEAARLVLCEGKRQAESARICRTSRQNLHRAIKRIESCYEELGICPHCGQRLPRV